jgi:hypothetical protein
LDDLLEAEQESRDFRRMSAFLSALLLPSLDNLPETPFSFKSAPFSCFSSA